MYALVIWCITGLPSPLGKWFGCAYILHWLFTGSWKPISPPAWRGSLCLLLGTQELSSSWYGSICCCSTLCTICSYIFMTRAQHNVVNW